MRPTVCVKASKGTLFTGLLVVVAAVVVTFVCTPANAADKENSAGASSKLQRCAPAVGGPYSAFIGNGAYVCNASNVPKNTTARKLDQCLSYVYTGFDVFDQCFTDTFEFRDGELRFGVPSDFITGVPLEPGRGQYGAAVTGALYDQWYWNKMWYTTTNFIQMGNKIFLNTIWEAWGKRGAPTGSPFCLTGSEDACTGNYIGRTFDQRSNYAAFPIWHEFTMKKGKIDKWVVYFDMGIASLESSTNDAAGMAAAQFTSANLIIPMLFAHPKYEGPNYKPEYLTP